MNWLSPLVKKRISFWLLINWFFSSLILPLYMPLAQAAETNEMRQLMADSALDTDSRMSVTEGSRLLARKETVQPRHAKKSSFHSKKSSSSRKVHSLPSLGTDTAKSEVPNTTHNHEETDVQRWQGNFENLWGVMSSPDTNRAARDFATSQVTGMANRMAEDTVRDWLSHKGNARVSFSYPTKGSADVLIPAWNTPNHLIFGQAGVRLDKERNTWNAGLGWRYYPSKQWMLGVNSFYDYDKTGGNARWGAGVEARTDYLSLSANRYFRITDWHQSPLENMEDYDERPANGYDLRGKFWLPSFPKIGGELAYEKYFGKNVSTKGDASSPDALRDAPYTLTSTVNYTPFPLVTMSVGHKSGSVNETIAKLELNYQFGQPLNVQFDGENVKLMRSLAGSRYDFVDRNYNIVMQYRKQLLVSLTLPASLSGGSRSTIRITANAWAKHGVKKIDWQSPDLQAAGGAITPGASLTQVKVKLPAWKARGNNTYRLTAVMTDRKGNSTDLAEMLLQVEPNTAQIGSGDLVVNKETAVADGADIVTYTALVKDAKGNPAEDQEVNWQSTLGNLAAASSVTDKDGKATITLTSVVVGSAQVSASVNEKPAVNAPKVAFIADVKSAQIGKNDLRVDKNSILANNEDKATFTAVVKDANGNLVANHPVNWSTDRGKLSATSSRTNDKGQAVIVLTGSQVGVAQVSASVNSNPGVSAPKVTLLADNATARINSGDLTVDKTKVIANNTDKATYTARVTDASGNTLQHYKVIWSTDKGTLSATESITDAEGKARIELRDTKVGTAVVTATVRNNGTKAKAVTFSADVNTAKIVVVSAKDKIIGMGKETTQLTATVTDANDNVLSDYPLTWSSTLGKVTGNSGNTDAKGKATATLTALHVAPKNGKATVTAGGSTGKGGSTEVTVSAVIKAGDHYYWTMLKDHLTSTESIAHEHCKTYGDGKAASSDDLKRFKKDNGDFARMKVTGEFLNEWYKLSGTWGAKSGDFHSGELDVGSESTYNAGTGYVCVK